MMAWAARIRTRSTRVSAQPAGGGPRRTAREPPPPECASQSRIGQRADTLHCLHQCLRQDVTRQHLDSPARCFLAYSEVGQCAVAFQVRSRVLSNDERVLAFDEIERRSRHCWKMKVGVRVTWGFSVGDRVRQGRVAGNAAPAARPYRSPAPRNRGRSAPTPSPAELPPGARHRPAAAP